MAGNMKRFCPAAVSLAWLLLLLLLLGLTTLIAEDLSSRIRGGGAPPISTTRRHLQDKRQTKKQNSKKIQKYKLWSSEEIHNTLQVWAKHYPDLVRVTTAQEAYGLATAGGSDDCPFQKGRDGCLNYILTIQDFVAHPEGSNSSNRLPEVLWSGEVHGNEQVGPTAVLEAAQLLMDAAACEALPRRTVQGSDDWEQEVANALNCRRDFADMGIHDAGRQWLARLVTTRRIVIVPTANALGYFRSQREEGATDPNRDFPYDLTNPKLCMKTIAARTLNEVFREHLFQLSLTFHGGMEVIGYEWGAPYYRGDTSPDDIAQKQIAAAYSFFGGGWSRSKPYAYGPMNDLVYPVHGGMEDWAYAASFDPDRVPQCDPDTFGGYPAEKTTYGPGTLRVFNMLVESSDSKIPPQSQLGTSEDVLKHSTAGTGYVSRNMRISLLAADLVQPFVRLINVNELSLSDDVVPLQRHEGRSCMETNTVSVPHNNLKAVLEWTVGGAIHIYDTQLWYAKWSDIPDERLNCVEQPQLYDVKDYMKSGAMISESSGTRQFYHDGQMGSFAAKIDIADMQKGDKIVVIASARVDQGWAKKPQDDDVKPDMPPQSHIVNARTNTSWYFKNEYGKEIQGRLDWFSAPVTIVLDEREDPTGGQDDNDEALKTIEVSSRYTGTTQDGRADEPTTPQVATTPDDDRGSDTVTQSEASNLKDETSSHAETLDSGGENKAKKAFFAVALVVGAVLATGFVGFVVMRSRMRYSQRSRLREFIEDESAPTPGLRHKKPRQKKRQQYSDLDDPEYGESGGGGEVEMGEYS